ARIDGARCLDLFAGSGALGLEALSRGAAQVVFVDLSPKVQADVRRMLKELGGETRAQFYYGAALDYLVRGSERFDIVFVDPPYHQNLVLPALKVLPAHLAAGHRVYLEAEELPDLPEGWKLLKRGKAGQVVFGLAAYSP
ncbi:MAG: RsmD family RNA methyltransferase, partial [Gammaproteobacteria bacterium]